MKSKTEPHAIRRALERYGLRLSIHDLQEIAKLCALGDYRVSYRDRYDERHIVPYLGKMLEVLYRPYFGPGNWKSSSTTEAGTIISIFREGSPFSPFRDRPVSTSVTTEGRGNMSGLAYVIRPMDPPHDMRPAAVLTCGECAEKEKLSVAGLSNNPERINQQFIKRGWDANVWKSSKNYCPKCVEQRRIRATKEVKVIDNQRPSPPKPAAPQHFAEARPVATTPSTHTGVEIVSIKSLNSEQKFALRRALDSSFDDAKGRYIDGNNDHVISEKTGIPRAVVAEFRENLYGPLQEDPFIADFRKQIDQLTKLANNLQESARKMEIRLDEYRKKVGL